MNLKISAGIHILSKDNNEKRHAIWPFSNIKIQNDVLIMQCAGKEYIIQKEMIEKILHIQHIYADIRIFTRTEITQTQT